MILYLETNFIMGAATGRDAEADSLLSVPTDRLRIVIPSVCIMEALSAYEDERKRRNRLSGHIDEQVSQLRRDVTSLHAESLLQALEQARLHNENLLNDIERRLVEVVRRLAVRADLINLTPKNCLAGTGLMDEPTDDLILTMILEHAAGCPQEPKALVTGNTKDFDADPVRGALAGAGIRFFATAKNFLGWLEAQGAS